MVPWNGSRTKVQLKLSIQRLRTLQEKKLALAKKSRRDIADLLLKNRIETARLRVEGLIQDDIYVELLELLELYVELLSARFNLLDSSTGTEPEGSISDAVCAIVYAAPRTELKELQQLREMLMHKYGRPFALSLQSTEPAPPSVPARISSKLAVYTPERELVDAYLYEIAKGYNVDWRPEPPADSSEANLDSGAPAKGDDGSSDDAPGGVGEVVKKPEAEAVAVANESPKKGGAGLPDADAKAGGSAEKSDKAEKAEAAPASAPVTKKLSPEEELAARFERLKQLR